MAKYNGVLPRTPYGRPKSEIYTPKRDDEHPCPFHVGKPHPKPPTPHPPAFLTISTNQIGSSDQSEACRAKNILFE